MMTNLMTILERKAFISSNPRIVLSSCSPPCGHFSIQESATGGLSYKVKRAAQGCPFFRLFNSKHISIFVNIKLIFQVKFPQKKYFLRYRQFLCCLRSNESFWLLLGLIHLRHKLPGDIWSYICIRKKAFSSSALISLSNRAFWHSIQ